jgi:hypothetical protein
MESRGWETTVPDLRTASDSPARFCQHAANSAEAADVVIGHSGAGAFLPAVVDATRAAVTVFVDAVVPSSGPFFTPSATLVTFLDSLPIVDGRLPPWHEWWPADLLAELVPDETLRRRITAEIPQLPRSFYDEAVPVPSQWWTRPTAYVQLSSAYDDERTRAELWRWPTSRLAGSHLDVCVRPDLVADQIIDLVDRLQHSGYRPVTEARSTRVAPQTRR